jgi:hypothetical protein
MKPKEIKQPELVELHMPPFIVEIGACEIPENDYASQFTFSVKMPALSYSEAATQKHRKMAEMVYPTGDGYIIVEGYEKAISAHRAMDLMRLYCVPGSYQRQVFNGRCPATGAALTFGRPSASAAERLKEHQKRTLYSTDMDVPGPRQAIIYAAITRLYGRPNKAITPWQSYVMPLLSPVDRQQPAEIKQRYSKLPALFAAMLDSQNEMVSWFNSMQSHADIDQLHALHTGMSNYSAWFFKFGSKAEKNGVLL